MGIGVLLGLLGVVFFVRGCGGSIDDFSSTHHGFQVFLFIRWGAHARRGCHGRCVLLILLILELLEQMSPFHFGAIVEINWEVDLLIACGHFGTRTLLQSRKTLHEILKRVDELTNLIARFDLVQVDLNILRQRFLRRIRIDALRVLRQFR